MKSDMTIKEKMKRYGSLMPFLIPCVALALLFSYIPMVGILMAFKGKINLFLYEPFEAFVKAPWSMENFAKIFENEDFMKILGNTLLISVLKIAVLFPIPIIFALLFAEIKNPTASKLMQSVMYLPYFLSWAVATGIFMNMFSSYGMVNTICIKLGLMSKDSPVLWYQNPSKFLFLMLFTGGWKDIGWSMIVYVSAILSIDSTYYEAARLDGAGKMQQIFLITLPLIKGTIVTMFILRICYILDAGFDQIFTMLNNSTRDKWEIIGTYVYRVGLQQSDYGFSTAVGLLNSVAALVIIIAGNFIVKKFSGKGIW
ncbi:MAG: ABC transporter permease subunit [Clostridia bacterium]|nr:ABC transporter permease subunit [Clostridia bacterium]